jgi:hypothetical protein
VSTAFFLSCFTRCPVIEICSNGICSPRASSLPESVLIGSSRETSPPMGFLFCAST